MSTPACRFGSEWAVNQHRDSHALYVGFDSLASFFSIAENEAVGRVKFSSLQARGAVHFCADARRHPTLRGFVADARPPRGPENDSTVRAAAAQRRRLAGLRRAESPPPAAHR